MALKAVITEDEFNGLDESTQEHYEEHDGSYFLKVEPVGGIALEDVSGLKSTLNDWKTKASKLRKDKEKWSTVLPEDATPEQIRDALEKVSEMDDWDPDKKNAEWRERERKKLEEALKKETEKLAREYTTEIQGREQRISSLTQQIIQDKKTAARAQALAEQGGDPYLLGPLLDSRLHPLTDDDGNIIGIGVVDDKGEVMMSGPLNREPMTPAQFVEHLRDDERYAPAFGATRASGSGARTSENNHRSSSGVLRPQDFDSHAAYVAKRQQILESGRQLDFKP